MAAVGDKGAPFGLWRITLPAGQTLSLPEKLPLPHVDHVMNARTQVEDANSTR
ncbi:hypothetical protein WSS_A33555 [Rhodococcus opacus M213]|uniref:Uncharacterized protein n=1 Tax=Rhodococcus opacus M213 TaxID=1129896 RepID=K8XBT9_RHOOP|nr:hypothetical protein WSS_A33555 [Rhodococcus opacus M213]